MIPERGNYMLLGTQRRKEFPESPGRLIRPELWEAIGKGTGIGPIGRARRRTDGNRRKNERRGDLTSPTLINCLT